jgi:hypothetical protein
MVFSVELCFLNVVRVGENACSNVASRECVK